MEESPSDSSSERYALRNLRREHRPHLAWGLFVLVLHLWGQRTPMEDSAVISEFAITKANLQCYTPLACGWSSILLVTESATPFRGGLFVLVPAGDNNFSKSLLPLQ